MTLDPTSDRDLLLVAGGVGLAPLKALAEQVARLDVPRRTHLFHGARTAAVYDVDAQAHMESQYPWLTVVLVSPHDDFEYEGELGGRGRSARHGPWTGRDVHVCGSPVMRAGAPAALMEAAVPEERVRSEEFAEQLAPRSRRGAVR